MKHVVLELALLALTAPMLIGCSDRGASSAQETGYVARTQHVEVEVTPVRRQALSSDVEFTGSLLPRRYSRITAQIDGVVSDIPNVGRTFEGEHQGRRYSEKLGITYGQAVNKGDVLLQLDPRDLEIELLIAQSKLTKAQADLDKLLAWERPEEMQRLTALRDEAQARHERAVSELRRIVPLVNREVVTQSEYEQHQTEVNTTKAILAAAQTKITAAEAGPTKDEIAINEALVAQAEAELQKRKRDLEKATIRAPFDGVVTAFNVEVGDRVMAANGAVVDLMDLRYLIAEIGVPESYVGSIAVNDEAAVRVGGEVEPVAGLVVAINDLVDAQTRTFRVRVAIDNHQRRFKAGQFAEVDLAMSAAESNVLTVPTRSIVFLEGQPHVFVIDAAQAQLTAIKIGMSSATNTEVLSGLHEGASVVTDDPTLLSDGMNVSVKLTTAPLADSGDLQQPTT